MLQAKEELLVLAAQQGNDEAFTFLCRFYQQSVTHFAYKICGDQQLVQEAIQNTWLKLTKNLYKLDDPRAFKAWLFKTVRWCTYDLMRKAKKDSDIFEYETSVEQLEASQQADKSNLSYFINLLSDIDKQVIHLFYFEQMRLTQISKALEIPVGTVKSRLNRARKMLKTSLEEHEHEHEY